MTTHTQIQSSKTQNFKHSLMRTSFLAFLILCSASLLQAKQFEHQISLGRIAKDKCFFIGRFHAGDKPYMAIDGDAYVDDTPPTAERLLKKIEDYTMEALRKSDSDGLDEKAPRLTRLQISIIKLTHSEYQQYGGRFKEKGIVERFEEHGLLQMIDLCSHSMTYRHASVEAEGMNYFYICDYKRRVKDFVEEVRRIEDGDSSHLNDLYDEDAFLRDNRLGKLYLKFKVKSADSYLHGTYEEKLTIETCFAFFLVYFALAGFLLKRTYDLYKENRSVDGPLAILVTVALVQLMSIVAKILHAAIHDYWGYNSVFLTLLYLVWHSMADLILSLLFILFAKGFATLRNMLSLKVTDTDAVLMVLVVTFRYIGTICGFFVNFDTEEHYHMYSGVIWWVDLLSTQVFFGYFWYCLKNSEIGREISLRKFKNTFVALACLQYILRPVMISFVEVFHYEIRFIVALIIGLGVNLTVLATTSIMLISKNSSYMKVTIFNSFALN